MLLEPLPLGSLPLEPLPLELLLLPLLGALTFFTLAYLKRAIIITFPLPLGALAFTLIAFALSILIRAIIVRIGSRRGIPLSDSLHHTALSSATFCVPCQLTLPESSIHCDTAIMYLKPSKHSQHKEGQCEIKRFDFNVGFEQEQKRILSQMFVKVVPDKNCEI